MTKKTYVHLLVGAAVLAGAWLSGEYLIAHTARSFLEQFRAGLPAGTELTYGTLESSLLRRDVSLSDLKVTIAGPVPKSFSAARLELQGVPIVGTDHVTLSHVAMIKPQIIFGQTVSADSLSFEGLTATPAETHFDSAAVARLSIGEQNAPATLAVETLKLGALDSAGVLASLSGETLVLRPNATDANQTLTIGQFSAAGVHVAALLDRQLSPAALLLRDSLQELDLSEVQLVQAEGTLKADRVHLAGVAGEGGYRKHVEIAMGPVHLPIASAPAEFRSALGDSLGGAVTLPVTLDLAAAYDPSTKRLTVERVRLVSEGQGEVVGSGSFGEVTSLAQLEMPLGLVALSLVEFELRYTDAGLVQRRLAAEAERMAVTPDVNAEQIIGRLAPKLESLGSRGAQLQRSLFSFLIKPSRLTLVARPPAPVPLARLASIARYPSQLVDTIGFFSSYAEVTPATQAGP